MSKSPVRVSSAVADDKKPPEPASSPEQTATEDTPAPPSLFARLFAIKPGPDCSEQVEKVVLEEVRRHLQAAGSDAKYNVLFLHDPTSIAQNDANRIYSAIKGCNRERPLLLFLNSPGGDVAAAYLIAKVCREHTKSTFEVVVPRQAKSAATLICCGADKIHMGSLSELGPIDPQFSNIPALAYKHSLEHLAQLATDYPGSSQMFSEYLAKTLPIQVLGYFERVAKSASQYASRLLASRRIPTNDTRKNAELSERLVYLYKDHGFVIDAAEAAEIFGDNVVSLNSDEYNAGSDIFESLDLVSWYCRTRLNRTVSLVGADDGCLVLEIPSGGAA